MPWVVRGRRRYFYESTRVDGVARRRYVGTGEAANQAADPIARRRSQRAADAQAVREAEQRHEKATALLDLLFRITNLAVTVELTRQGYHQHCRHWRQRRVTTPNQTAGAAKRGTGQGNHPEG